LTGGSAEKSLGLTLMSERMIIRELRHFVELMIDMGARVTGVLGKLAAVLFLVVFLGPIMWPVYALTLGMGWTFLLVWFGLCSWLIFSVVDTEKLTDE